MDPKGVDDIKGVADGGVVGTEDHRPLWNIFPSDHPKGVEQVKKWPKGKKNHPKPPVLLPIFPSNGLVYVYFIIQVPSSPS
jgi:hypothetical protein